MRLLDTKTLTLHEFCDDADTPRYAILSHRWEKSGEVTFEDLQLPRDRRWSKIFGCCAQAARDGWQYVWVDSCCIDKKSSSELSEAINSMYQWYKRSQVCYVYLSDVTTVPTGLDGDTHDRKDSEFRHSKWFTRGWTLQELIAPKTVHFYDRSWREIGTRRSMESLISDITGIRSEHFRYPRNASVAQRMSWASKRKTSRVEDHAYSLLGLFDISMPLLYGEGWNAFQRLQFEVIAKSDDESIFAWNPVSRPERALEGIFAMYPEDFITSGDIVMLEEVNSRPPYYITNKGLRMEVFLLPNRDGPIQYGHIVPLHCVREGADGCIGVHIHNNALPGGKVEYGLIRRDNLVLVEEQERPPERTVVFLKQPTPQEIDPENEWYFNKTLFVLATDSLLLSNFTVFQECGGKVSKPYLARHVESYREGPSQGCINLHQRWNIVYLNFMSGAYDFRGRMKVGSKKPDVFVVILHAVIPYGGVCVDIQIPRVSRPRGDNVEIGLPENRLHLGDRISKTMRSGQSVSAVLRRKPDLGRPVYLLEITIDPEGKLPWPNLNRTYTTIPKSWYDELNGKEWKEEDFLRFEREEF